MIIKKENKIKKLILITLSLTSLVFGSCGQVNCGCQDKENKEFKCENQNKCNQENCSNKNEEFKCGSAQMYQNDITKTISNTNDIVNKK